MTDGATIEIRLLGLEDGAALARLAELDTSEPPPFPVLGGIVDGRLVAALSLSNRHSIADPFRHTAEIRSLLAKRARQLCEGRGHRLFARLRGRLGDVATPSESASGAVR